VRLEFSEPNKNRIPKESEVTNLAAIVLEEPDCATDSDRGTIKMILIAIREIGGENESPNATVNLDLRGDFDESVLLSRKIDTDQPGSIYKIRHLDDSFSPPPF